MVNCHPIIKTFWADHHLRRAHTLLILSFTRRSARLGTLCGGEDGNATRCISQLNSQGWVFNSLKNTSTINIQTTSFHAHWWGELSGTCVIANSDWCWTVGPAPEITLERGCLTLMSEHCHRNCSFFILIAYGTGHTYEKYWTNII